MDVSELEEVTNPDGSTEYVFPETIRDKAENKVEERIVGSVFIPLGEAIRERDMFTMAAAGALFGHLLGEQALQLSGVKVVPTS